MKVSERQGVLDDDGEVYIVEIWHKVDRELQHWRGKTAWIRRQEGKKEDDGEGLLVYIV